MDKENIMHRIKKLLNLANVKQNDSPQEAAQAASKAQELLFTYNLEMVDIEGINLQVPEGYEKTESILNSNKLTNSWKSGLFFGVAKNNFCKAVGHPGERKISLIGKPSNIQIVVYLYEYLEREIERLATNYVKYILTKKASSHRNFCYGAMEIIRIRLAWQKEQNEKASEKSTALVVVKDKELSKEVKKHFPNLQRRSNSIRIVNRTAYLSGRTAGQGIAINQGVCSPSRKQIG